MSAVLAGLPSLGFVRRVWLTLFCAVLSVGVRAEGHVDQRLKVVDYASDQVLNVTLWVGYHLHIEFAGDEQFVSLGAGDTASLDVAAEGNHLFLKAREAVAHSNLTILTNRRVYVIDYRALAKVGPTDHPVYSLQFRYPVIHVPNLNTTSAAELRLGVPPLVKNSDYWFCGPASLRPSAAFDDGMQLRLSFPAQMEWPTVYVANPDGAEALVNSHTENDMLVIHHLAERFVLRRGSEVGCVINRHTQSGAQRASSGTVVESVERTTQAVQP